MFIPTVRKELRKLKWPYLDIILVSGDTYIDSPYMGISVIGHILIKAGYKVCIIAQPDINSDKDIARLGEPRLFWGISGGAVDSMVANRTALGKKRKSDDYTPGGINNKRPDRALIIYCNLIRKYFKNTVPLILGGIEASLRRIAHYDFAVDKIRRSVLLDAKADYLLYGMAERSVLELADKLRKKEDVKNIRGLVYVDKRYSRRNCLELPSFDDVAINKKAFSEMFKCFYVNNEPQNSKILVQKYKDRYLIQNPPQYYLSMKELDDIYALPYEREVHPYYLSMGKVKAVETIRFSIASHRGCYGECNFCAIGVHEGRTVRWRSKKSILQEVRAFCKHPRFKGIINDVGGPTANMYGYECLRKKDKGSCKNKRCIYPKVCPSLRVNHKYYMDLLEAIRKEKGVRKVFVGSGIRYDLIYNDKKHGHKFLKSLVKHYVSGQMKVAPEHTEEEVLKLMGKPNINLLLRLKKDFEQITKSVKKKQFLTYYMIAAHPGCELKDMRKMYSFVKRKLRIIPKQIQLFTPTPSTFSTLMFYTERNPFTAKKCYVAKSFKDREKQISVNF